VYDTENYHEFFLDFSGGVLGDYKVMAPSAFILPNTDILSLYKLRQINNDKFMDVRMYPNECWVLHDDVALNIAMNWKDDAMTSISLFKKHVCWYCYA
jgi:hypothetical protein